MQKENTMKCFQHNKNDSIGLCKACMKAVCASCSTDTGRGLACSEECVTEVHDLNKFVDISKNLYKMENNPQQLPTFIMLYFMLSVIFFSWGVYDTLQRGIIDYFMIASSIVFFVLGVISYNRYKKANELLSKVLEK